MTVKFNSNIRNLMIGMGLYSIVTRPSAISVYSGSQPSAANIISNWATSYNSSNPALLGHFVGCNWSNPNNSILLQLAPPGQQNAVNTGTATWCIVWQSNVQLADMAGSSIPNLSFIVGKVSNTLGDGIVRFADPTLFVSGNPIAIADGSIGATSY